MKVRVKARGAKDVRLAKKLERYLNSPGAQGDINASVQRAFANLLLYGPNKERWPN